MGPKSIGRSLVRRALRPLRRRPRIVMTLLCRDEEDIVGYNIAYHLAQGVDLVIATDHGSQDRTPRLLEGFARQGRLKLILEPGPAYDQGTWVTRMARMAAARFDADWVINNDCDEFWRSRHGTVRQALEAAPRGARCLPVPRFDMVPPRDPAARFFEAAVIRIADGTSVHGGKLQPKTCHRAYPDVKIAEGNHFVKRKGKLLAGPSDHPLQILHFPLRSVAQFERKIRQGGEALRANARLSPGIGAHWRWLYRDYLLEGRLGAYYEERALSPERIAAGLASGALVQDTHIRDALRCIDPALADPERRSLTP